MTTTPASGNERIVSKDTLERLREKVANDPTWRVAQLILGPRVFEMWSAVAPLIDKTSADVLPPIPPVALRRIVSDSEAPMFLWTGAVDAAMVVDIISQHLSAAGSRGDARHGTARCRLLDLGGGCGRLARHLMNVDGYEVVLADTNPEHVAWCRENLPRVQALRISPETHEVTFAHPFEVVVAISVFTHLSLVAFENWLAKLRSICAPGGLVIATLHGTWALRYVATNATLQEYFRMPSTEATSLAESLDARGFIYRKYDQDQLDAAKAGDDYGLTFISQDRYRELCRKAGFDVLDYRVAGLRGWQDVSVLRAR